MGAGFIWFRAMPRGLSANPGDVGNQGDRSLKRSTEGVLLCALSVTLTAPWAGLLAAQQPPTAPTHDGQTSQTKPAATFPRGERLFLKDGSFELVREYQIEGDRVRYYSLDSSSWEVMPANLVDWDATKKAEAEEAKRDATLNEKVHKQEAERIVAPLDIDASLEVAPGVFLPPGVNLFSFDGKSVLPLPQAETSSKISKGRLLEQVMIPVPIVPSRQNVSIQGAHAKFRLHNSQPEFYLRVADEREPRLDLIRAKIHGDTRLIEHLDALFGEKTEQRDSISMQKWKVAQGVYRFTLSQPLTPGEYALAQTLDQEGMSLYVWDFGVDSDGAPGTAKTN
jgi:hypothetical protein